MQQTLTASCIEKLHVKIDFQNYWKKYSLLGYFIGVSGKT